MKKSVISILALSLAICTLFTGCSKFAYENEYVKLAEYKGLKTCPATVDEAELEMKIDAAIAQTLMNQGTTPTPVEDRDTVENGDVLNIDYEGKIKDVAFQGGTAQGQTLIIGSGTYIPGFEEQLIGKKAGETCDINVTFPSDYPTADLAGQNAVFTVTINSIGVYPELTDEQAQTFSYNQAQTVADYRAMIAEQILYEAVSNRQNFLWFQILDNSEVIKYPDGEIETQINEMMAYYEQMAASQEITLEEYLANYNMTVESFTADMRARCEETVKQQIIKEALAEAENLTLSDEEYSAGVAKYAQDYGFSDVTTFEEQFGVETIKESLMAEKIMAMLEANCKEEKGFTYTSKN